ncbi:similar to Saccharomyces cerevisiae YDR459C PFA5 Palmitoyltransferase with autoacylation activity [Maudiozyma saulgeensis]|uniref:Palmitoyltransferase n=1 Tax=Maudiozyma saulgeensis TaxID=1789683 RepID=A0A1X7R6V2_9SACH|nr:similar to Saccharomyces cerevisiae YDR459C PFA5 Palmitoyltransferase with autoacylation activity [Kazachstania saulgeensis]
MNIFKKGRGLCYLNQIDCSFDFRNNRFFKLIVPTIFVCLLIYGSWAFIHKLCINQLYNKSDKRATGIALIVTHGCLLLIDFYLWFLIVTRGPGIQPIVPTFEIIEDSNEETNKDVIRPPSIFECNVQGYPIWCPYCGSVKAFRSHHSRSTGSCVPKFDHYCSWLGSVIGQDNYKMFLQFLIYISITFGIMWISTIICYLKNFQERNHDGNLIVIVILAGLGFFFTTGLLGSHIYYIVASNLRSIDIIALKSQTMRDKIVFISIWDEQTKKRYVVEITREQYCQFWDMGSVYGNLKDVFGSNIWTWLIPSIIFTKHRRGSQTQDIEGLENILDQYNVTVNDMSIERIKDKIRRGEYVCIMDAFGDYDRKSV